MKKTLFIKNAAILTATSIILKFLGIIFKIWLSSSVGSEGIGLYHLLFSFYILISAFTTTGIPTAVTRLCTKQLCRNNQRGAFLVVKRALSVCLCFALFSFIAVWTASPFIAETLLNDSRALPSIKIMCLSLPFLAFSSVFKGYFLAKRNAALNSFTLLFEQITRIGCCVFLINKFSLKNIELSVAAVVFSDVLAEIVSFLIPAVFFLKEKRKSNCKCGCCSTKSSVTKEIIRISTPILLGRYSTSFLRTWENMLVPKALSKTLSYSTALSAFGTIKGMALPVLFFPSSLLNAVSTLLLPEISEACSNNHHFIIKNAVKKTVKTTWLLGVIFGGIFFFCGEKIGNILYRDTFSGKYIKFLSLIVPLMYLDSICDGILKGLDFQNFSFFVSLADSSLRILLIFIFVPEYSMKAFLIIMILSNIFTCFLNVGKLLKYTGIKPNIIKEIFLPVLFSAFICRFCSDLLSFLRNDIAFIAVFSVFSFVLFVLITLITKTADINDYI